LSSYVLGIAAVSREAAIQTSNLASVVERLTTA